MEHSEKHHCFSKPSCMYIAKRLTEGQDTWFCVGSVTVSVRRMTGRWFRITSTDRKTSRQEVVVVSSPEDAQAECRHFLRACPYLITDNLVACGECSRHLASFNVASTSAEQS